MRLLVTKNYVPKQNNRIMVINFFSYLLERYTTFKVYSM